MIDKIKRTLMKEYSYKIESHKVLHEEIKKNKLIIPGIILFIVVTVMFFTTDIIDFIILCFSFFVLVIIPFALRREETYDIVVVTPEYLIKQTSKNKVSAIRFDNIKKFGTDKTGVVIRDDHSSISLDPSVLKEEVLTVIEILEAKGKTFDKSKDYMIRPIKIAIVDNEIRIIDIKEDESLTNEIVSEKNNEYPMITPGFIDDIILMNSVVEGAYLENDNLCLKISRFEVKEGHPENTLFESQIANDCILIFENAVVSSIIKKDANGPNEEVIEASLDNLILDLDKAVISNWKCLDNVIDFEFAIELYIVRTSIKYDEIIVGWKEFI